MKRRSICIVNKHFAPHVGGIETVVEQHAKALATAFDVEVAVCADLGDKTERYQQENISVRKFKTQFKLLKVPFSLGFFWHILANKNDIFYLHEPFPFGMMCLWLLRKRNIVVFYHSDIIKQKRAKQVVVPVQKRLFRRVTKIIAASQNIVRFSDVLPQFASKVSVVPFWLENVPKAARSGSKTSENSPFIFLGRWSTYKGLGILVDAIKSLPKDIPFQIVGQGDCSHLLDPIRQFENVEIIEGFVSETEKQTMLFDARALLFPSISENEAFGIMQLEAMQLGTPVINTDLKSGVPEIARHEIEALTVPPGRSSELASAILRLSRDENLCERLSRNCIERAKEFDETILSEKLVAVFAAI